MLIWLNVILANPLLACRFTIREIGYTPLQLQTYIMQLDVDTVNKRGLFNDFIQRAGAYEGTTNIRYRVTHRAGDNKAVMMLKNTKGIIIAKKDISSPGQIAAFYREILFSPLQRTIRQQTGNVFAFLVCFCDPEDKETDVVVQRALEQFRKLAPSLDKAVSEEIMKIVVPAAGREEERIILRSAGVDPAMREPVVVILYGRGRLVEEPLTGDDITKDKILTQLVMLGTDCECGIDLSPMLQRAIPLQWTDKMSQKVADMLGFDAGNPMTLTEMSKILAKEPATTVDEALSFAPRTVDLDKALGNAKNKNNTPPQEILPSRTWKNTLLITGSFLLILVTAGTVIFFIRKR